MLDSVEIEHLPHFKGNTFQTICSNEELSDTGCSPNILHVSSGHSDFKNDEKFRSWVNMSCAKGKVCCRLPLFSHQREVVPQQCPISSPYLTLFSDSLDFQPVAVIVEWEKLSLSKKDCQSGRSITYWPYFQHTRHIFSAPRVQQFHPAVTAR